MSMLKRVDQTASAKVWTLDGKGYAILQSFDRRGQPGREIVYVNGTDENLDFNRLTSRSWRAPPKRFHTE
jgi:hypothetical protein